MSISQRLGISEERLQELAKIGCEHLMESKTQSEEIKSIANDDRLSVEEKLLIKHFNTAREYEFRNYIGAE